MKLSLTTGEVAQYTARQLEHFFPDGRTVAADALRPFLDETLDRVDHCFRHINFRGYSDETGQARFDVLHSDQYCAYLYYLSNTVHRRAGDPALAAKLFYLNKSLHAFNCMYDTELPRVFWPIHVVGTVLGKARYGNYLAVHQNCTVGAIGGHYPALGDGVILSAGASVIGACSVGSNVVLGPGVGIVKRDVPDNTRVTAEATFALHPNGDRALSALFRVGTDFVQGSAPLPS